MKNALVLFLSLIFCVLPAAQDLPDDILADQYLLEATKALENDDPQNALRAFEKIEDLDVEPPPEFLFFYGKLLVEHSTVPDDLLRGQSYLKQYVLSIEKGSEHYRSALELLLTVEKRIGEVYAAERRRQEAAMRNKEADIRARELGIEMILIPGGTFRMGDLSGGGRSNERPVHSVTIRPFKLSKYEVTFAQWDACVDDGGCGGYRPKDRGWGRGNRPVINISWHDAQLFIDWLNGKTSDNWHLPTEAEWEYAARAGSTTAYSWGNNIGVSRANCDGCGSGWDNEKTAPVGSFPPNAWGMHDTHGNVWEWVQDCANDSYAGAPNDGLAWMSGDCNYRRVRGGSWVHSPTNLRSAYRYGYHRTARFPSVGFRVAQGQ